MKKQKKVPEHFDVLGNSLDMGTTVAVSHRHGMEICQVVKLNNRMLRVMPVKPKYRGDGFLKYPTDMVTVDPQLVTLYALKHS
jgi:hypothetical protein